MECLSRVGSAFVGHLGRGAHQGSEQRVAAFQPAGVPRAPMVSSACLFNRWMGGVKEELGKLVRPVVA
jgi:hypothetical protein